MPSPKPSTRTQITLQDLSIILDMGRLPEPTYDIYYVYLGQAYVARIIYQTIKKKFLVKFSAEVSDREYATLERAFKGVARQINNDGLPKDSPYQRISVSRYLQRQKLQAFE